MIVILVGLSLTLCQTVLHAQDAGLDLAGGGTLSIQGDEFTFEQWSVVQDEGSVIKERAAWDGNVIAVLSAGNEEVILTADRIAVEFDGDTVSRMEAGPEVNFSALDESALFKCRDYHLFFRCPTRFKHRPSQCDLLHVDLFYQGINILRDGGTFGYNCEQPWQDYFKSASAHNTVKFDDHDQMPRISRFLYGKWPKLSVRSNCETRQPYVVAGFTDWKGCGHHRKVEVDEKSIRIKDRISGFKTKAVIRWRLAPELKWRLIENVCISTKASLTVSMDSGLKGVGLVRGWESLYYGERTPLQALEMEVDNQCHLITTRIDIGEFPKNNSSDSARAK